MKEKVKEKDESTEKPSQTECKVNILNFCLQNVLFMILTANIMMNAANLICSGSVCYVFRFGNRFFWSQFAYLKAFDKSDSLNMKLIKCAISFQEI